MTRFVFLVASLSACSLLTSLDDLRGAPAASDAAASDVEASAPGLYVDAKAGADSNAGNDGAPFKTLKHAFATAKSGDSIFVRPGTYDAANGEDFSAFVPDGVSIHGTAPGVTLAGDAVETAFAFAGSATIDGLATTGFLTVFKATSGTQTVTNVRFDGASIGADISGSAHFQLQTVTSSSCATVARVAGTATLTMKGAQIFSAGKAANPSVLDAQDGAELSLDTVNVNGATATNIVRAASTTKLTMTACTFDASAAGGVRIEAGATATITSGAFKSLMSGIVTYAKTTVTDTEVSGSTGTGIDVLDGADVTVTNATVTQNQNGGVYVQNAHLTLRGSKVVNNSSDGVWAFGNAMLNLGTSSTDSGGNTFTGNGGSALDVAGSSNSEFVAKGNTWVPNVQGADAQGSFLPGTIITGTMGGNFAASSTQMIYVGM